MIIRTYQQKDRAGIEKINFQTGFLGESMNKMISSPKLWSWGIKHYFEQEPESIFVAEEDGLIVGYILGFVEEFKYDRKKIIIKSMFRNLRFIFNLILEDKIFWLDKIRESFVLFMKSLFGQRFHEPNNSGHMHINLLPSVRGQGVGRKLLERFLAHARSKGAIRIYANSYQLAENLKKNFWTQNDFREYSKIKTTFWRQQLPEKEVYLVCYVKDLG